MLVGYMRVSKADGSQTTDLQRDALIAAGVEPDALYEDKASGKREDRPRLVACLKALKTITHPTLVINGQDDVMVPTVNSYLLSQHLPNAQLIIYPDSGHGALFQYPETLMTHTRLFLDAE
ncbi:alpha/beta fold hydrolase [Microbacterium sp. A93]|uniref:alpha/beta fold hydrolase n=1 Tax=Microbacterium sp. A93 TaxID=3450716 RepID=UPI003F4254C5